VDDLSLARDPTVLECLWSPRAGHRDSLLAVRRGEVAWTEVDAWRRTLTRDLDTALAATGLPAEPDRSPR
jgi:hypothetical protein